MTSSIKLYALVRFSFNYIRKKKASIYIAKFSFLVYDAFEQWKRLVKILCLSELALSSRPTLFLDFISVLHYHLKEVPEQFFVDIVTKNNFLTTTLQV